MDAISSNLANINTTRTLGGGPYRRKVPVFGEMLDKTVGGYKDIGGVRVLEVAEDQTPPRLAYQPEHPDADEDGYVALPNVNLVREMTDMLVASRAYEANLAVADSAKSMWSGALEIIRG
jgi:flagellar basal-body rod protein FlgC